MKALILNCTLKPSPTTSNTEALANVLAESLRARDVTVDMMRVVDADIPPGVESDLGEGDDWPGIRQQILDAEILVIATPTRAVRQLDVCMSHTLV